MIEFITPFQQQVIINYTLSLSSEELPAGLLYSRENIISIVPSFFAN